MSKQQPALVFVPDSLLAAVKEARQAFETALASDPEQKNIQLFEYSPAERAAQEYVKAINALRAYIKQELAT